jgi:hypothetical protein
MKTPLLTFLFAMSLQIMGICQSITNVAAKTDGEQILISYDLAGKTGESYEIRLTCSLNDGKSFDLSPEKVTGAVNRWEVAGTAKSITWEARKDLGNFEGDLKFKVEAKAKAGSDTQTAASNPINTTTSSTGSRSVENSDINFTITGQQDLMEGLRLNFKVKVKKDCDLGFSRGAIAEDQFGNVYSIISIDLEGVDVLGDKTRKLVVGIVKEGKMILKVSQLNSPSLKSIALKKLQLQTTVGTLVLTNIPR